MYNRQICHPRYMNKHLNYKAMEKINKKYIDDHRYLIHDYASFGRNVADLILQAASQQVEKEGEKESVELQATINMRAYEPNACIEVEICLPIVGCAKVHVGI